MCECASQYLLLIHAHTHTHTLFLFLSLPVRFALPSPWHTGCNSSSDAATRSRHGRLGEVRGREHAAVVRDVGGVAEVVVVLVVGAVVAVVPAAQADARGPGAERLDTKEEVGERREAPSSGC